MFQRSRLQVLEKMALKLQVLLLIRELYGNVMPHYATPTKQEPQIERYLKLRIAKGKRAHEMPNY